MAVHADEEEGTDSSAAAGAANTFDPWKSGAAAQPLPASSSSGFEDDFQPPQAVPTCEKLPDSEEYLAALEAK